MVSKQLFRKPVRSKNQQKRPPGWEVFACVIMVGELLFFLIFQGRNANQNNIAVFKIARAGYLFIVYKGAVKAVLVLYYVFA